MKKIYIFLLLSLMAGLTHLQAQTMLAKWTFPTGTSADSLTDGGVPANSNMAIRAVGTTAIDFSKNGNTTKAAQTTGWDNGAGTKYWHVMINASGYKNIKLSSRQQSGGNNPGPRDFIVQCRISSDDPWTDVSGGTVVTANDWTTGALTDLVLPSFCDNAAIVFLRWLMNSNTNSSGNTVTASGISKIDDIYFYGDIHTGVQPLTTTPSIFLYPNPVTRGAVKLETSLPKSSVLIMDQTGKAVYQEQEAGCALEIPVDGWDRGLYIVKVSHQGNIVTRKLVVQ